MDSLHVDQLARAIGSRQTRRVAVRLLGGIAAFATLDNDLEARRKKKRKKKCKAPKQTCGGKCVAIQTDDSNCGACGNRCSRSQICRGGQCEALVPPVDCPIGQCCEDDQVCNGDGRCRAGECQPRPACFGNGVTFREGAGECCSENVSCQVGTTGIDCTCLPGDPGNACLLNTDCSSGGCVGYQCVGCEPGTVPCNGLCVRLDTETNCGACGDDCEPGEFCQNGTCKPRYVQDGTWPSIAATNVFVDASHTVFAVNADQDCVRQFSESGTLEHVYGTCNETGSDSRHLYNPTGVVAFSSLVLIAESGNHRVQAFAREGDLIMPLLTGPGTGNYQVNLPSGITLDKDRNFYVVDRDNHRVQKFNSSGAYLRTFGNGTQGSGPYQFNLPYAVAVDGSGNVYVSDAFNHRVQKFDGNGNYVRTFGSFGTGPGQFNIADSVAVASTGDLFIVDRLNERVQQLNADGDFIRSFSGAPLDFPSGLALDDEDNLYVADYDAKAVFRFKLKAPKPS